VFHGRMYFNLSQFRHVSAILGGPFARMLRSLGHPEQIRPEDEAPAKRPAGKTLRALPDMLRIVFKVLRTRQVFVAHQAHTEQALARLRSVDPGDLPDQDISTMLQWWLDIAPDSIDAVFVMSGLQPLEDVIRKACERVGFPYERLVYPQLAAGQRSVSTQQAVDLVALADVARHETVTMKYLLGSDGAGGSYDDFRTALAGTMFLDRFERFLAEYGHRGRYESDWSIPRLHENPAPALFAVRGQLQGQPQNMKALAERQEADAAGARRAFEARMNAWQKLTMRRRVRSALRKLKQQYLWREQVRSDLTRILSRARGWHLVLADRFAARGWIDRRDDYFLLHMTEVKAAIADPQKAAGLRAIAADRAAQLAAERDLQMPLFMRESQLPALLRRSQAATHVRSVRLQPDHAGDVLTGLCVSPGFAEAEVVVMRDPSEFATMKRGAILVAPATDPSWTPLFTMASGVIVEVGGTLSHASTIAREYGLPALANVRNATKLLRTGDRVTLDASGGVVRRA
jgi:rifampicin phosphotransferase